MSKVPSSAGPLPSWFPVTLDAADLTVAAAGDNDSSLGSANRAVGTLSCPVVKFPELIVPWKPQA